MHTLESLMNFGKAIMEEEKLEFYINNTITTTHSEKFLDGH